MHVSIFGLGYVGAVSTACLAELGHSVIGVDISQAKLDLIMASKSPVIEPGVEERLSKALEEGRLSVTTDVADAVKNSHASLVSVGTPSAGDGTPDLRALQTVTADIGRAIAAKDGPHAVIIRSTIPPGTMRDMVIPTLEETSGRKLGDGLVAANNPEFLREGSAVADFYAPPFTVSGSPDAAGHAVLRELYEGIDAPVREVACEVAEAIKYLSNTYHAVKIAFANEMGSLLKAYGMDSRDAMALFCEDRDLNISAAYLRPGFAFGGSCLPKEVRSVGALARNRNIDLKLVQSLIGSNDNHIERAFEMISREGRQPVAMFGLSFKPNTDDLRESPFVVLAERLLGRGYDLKIFDKNLEMARLVGSNRDYVEREIPHLDKILSPSPEAALDGAKLVVIGHADAATLRIIEKASTDKKVFDLQGYRTLQNAGLASYEGMCW